MPLGHDGEQCVSVILLASLGWDDPTLSQPKVNSIRRGMNGQRVVSIRATE